MEIAILLVVLAVVLVGSTVAFVATRGRRGEGYLEAPPASPTIASSGTRTCVLRCD